VSVYIETGALRTMLCAILSCRCPVTARTEEAWVAKWREAADEQFVALDPFMGIADTNPERTPLHLFVDFCSSSKEDPETFTITEDDALRYFSCRYHFDQILSGIDPLAVVDPAAHMVGHMLLPAQIDTWSPSDGADCNVAANGHVVRLRHVVVPLDIAHDAPGGWYGVHFGTILTRIDARRRKMVDSHLRRIGEFRSFLSRVEEIDYSDYQSFGDYRRHVERRLARNGFLS